MAGFDAHKVKFYRLTDTTLPENHDASVRDAISLKYVDTCDGFCMEEVEKGDFGFCCMCGDRLYEAQHASCDEGVLNHCTRCGKAIA